MFEESYCFLGQQLPYYLYFQRPIGRLIKRKPLFNSYLILKAVIIPNLLRAFG